MAEYFNQVGCGIAEVAMLRFMHVNNGESEVIDELICQTELIPHLIALLQETYNKHMEAIANVQQNNNKNKALS